MIVIQPERVKFGDVMWGGVTALTVSVEAQRVVEAWGDAGPWCAMADVPERRCVVTLVRRLDGLRGDAPPGTSVGLWGSPRPGDQAMLSFGATTGRGDASGVLVRATAVVRSVRHRLRRGLAEQEIELLALGTAGGAGEPLEVVEVVGGLM